jgi:hypothetical protein
MSKFVKEVLDRDNINEQIREEFIAKVSELQGVILQLSILYNENIIWRKKQKKV